MLESYSTLATDNSRATRYASARACLTRSLSPRSPLNSRAAARSSYVQPAPSKPLITLNLCVQARSRARNPARPHVHTCARAPPQHAGKAQALGTWT